MANPAEGGEARFLKSHAEVLMNRSGCPDNLWFLCHENICAVHECCANEHINWETPVQKSGEDTPDISHIIGLNLSCTTTPMHLTPKPRRIQDILWVLVKMSGMR